MLYISTLDIVAFIITSTLLATVFVIFRAILRAIVHALEWYYRRKIEKEKLDSKLE